MNREFSLAGLLRLRQLQQDQAATGLARARSRSSSVRVREAAARRELAATDDPISSSASLRAVAAARSSAHSMLADLQNLTHLAEADEANARAEFIAARTRSVGLENCKPGTTPRSTPRTCAPNSRPSMRSPRRSGIAMSSR